VTAPLPSAGSFLILGALGIFQLGAAYVLFVYGVARVSATRASLVSMLEPVANPIWVFLALGETPSPFALAGGAVVLGAVAWRTVTREPARLASADPPPLD
jgi:drug/metabolite transporter (DMT)-like permease